MNTLQQLHAIGLNPFAVTLLAESMLKSAYVEQCGTKPLTFNFPIQRSDCAGWMGVRVTLEAVPVEVSGQAEARDYDEAVEALRQGLNALPRFSFHLDERGSVRRVEERSGAWIEWQSAHELFDAEVVDALLAKARAAAAIAKATGSAS